VQAVAGGVLVEENLPGRQAQVHAVLVQQAQLGRAEHAPAACGETAAVAAAADGFQQGHKSPRLVSRAGFKVASALIFIKPRNDKSHVMRTCCSLNFHVTIPLVTEFPSWEVP
jgi:hypothetical protein